MRRTRLMVVSFFGIVISGLCAYAIHKELESVATVFAASIGGIVAKYSHDETKRPSIPVPEVK